MAFAYTFKNSNIEGAKKKTWGTYTSSGGGTGGDIYTGLRVCDNLVLSPKGAAVATNQSVVNGTFPIVRSSGQASAKVTIVTDENQAGTWEAFGR